MANACEAPLEVCSVKVVAPILARSPKKTPKALGRPVSKVKVTEVALEPDLKIQLLVPAQLRELLMSAKGALKDRLRPDGSVVMEVRTPPKSKFSKFSSVIVPPAVAAKNAASGSKNCGAAGAVDVNPMANAATSSPLRNLVIGNPPPSELDLDSSTLRFLSENFTKHPYSAL